MTDDKEENDDKIKDFVLRNIYYNEQTGFQNQYRTYKAAKARLSSITPEFVKIWFSKQKTSNSSRVKDSTLILSMGPTKKLLLIWLISAVIISTIGVMVIFLLLWILLLSSHGQSL